MRNVSIDLLDDTPRPVVAIGTDYSHGHLLPRHTHRRAQLLYGATGVMQVSTQNGSWVVPPQRAVWIPAGTEHEVLMQGVSTRSLYIEPRRVDLGNRCQVISVSPLMRHLLMAAVEIPLTYDETGRDGALIDLLLHEVALSTHLPLHIPLPVEARLLKLCRAFLQQPNAHQTPQHWADQLHISLRTFNRLFRQQTGLSFSQWRQRACVVLALARLAVGTPVTRIALDLGYKSPAAFSTMFRRLLGQPPSVWLEGVK
ncbi:MULTISPECIES: helix-turn-helix transcriptional regulator [unclassified Pseudomonas]|uniref:AraC family transcriptional regulator n=1 Tax=unclassified Pseudomonas TaxID=196821 RepID=UPI002AC904DE|nr:MULTISPECIES: helix-turn-helix transcriptional regulator [unclassified Pseudomonas]MEB0047883.1 helix-turn-helix transcriptional regulator [Pseudomonas sp. Dout3]MEB0098966.1 helix-turn-helix transcriptional regulator [Pseudomonas sp. DC1.2]WPX57606.1 helix-turn-helix transcriptional regulator [Pseudomonas sp. DC1.2]